MSSAEGIENLTSLSKKQLVDLVVSLQKENGILKKYSDFMRVADEKIENLKEG